VLVVMKATILLLLLLRMMMELLVVVVVSSIVLLLQIVGVLLMMEKVSRTRRSTNCGAYHSKRTRIDWWGIVIVKSIVAKVAVVHLGTVRQGMV